MTNEGPCVSKIATKDLAEAVFPGRLPREELRIMVRPGAHAAMLAHAKTSLANEVCGVMLGVPKKDAQGPFLIVEDGKHEEALRVISTNSEPTPLLSATIGSKTVYLYANSN